MVEQLQPSRIILALQRLTEGPELGQVTDILELVLSGQGDTDVDAIVRQVSSDGYTVF